MGGVSGLAIALCLLSGLAITDISDSLNYSIIPKDLSNLYIALLMVTGLLFLGKFRVKKPGKRLLTVLLIADAVEFVLLLLMLLYPA